MFLEKFFLKDINAYLIVILICFFRILLTYNSPLNLSVDEAQYWLWSQNLELGFFSKPPLISWIIFISDYFFETSEFSIRFFSTLLHGFIAIILKKFIDDCEVEAWDISNEALKVAKKNAQTNNVKIDFKQVDILENNISSSSFDVIVSNPPYVDYCEKNQINSRVNDYEPANAIFVDHDDNMIFYKRIPHHA